MIRLGDLLPKLPTKRHGTYTYDQKPQEIVDLGCPWSGGALLLRQGAHGEFLGCSDWPQCEYTEPVVE